MEIQDRPSGFFITVSVEVLNYDSILRADDRSIGDGSHPIIAGDAACSFTRRGEVQGCPGRAGIPSAMRTACEIPGFSISEGEAHLRLGKAGRKDRFNGVIERVTKQRIISREQPIEID